MNKTNILKKQLKTDLQTNSYESLIAQCASSTASSILNILDRQKQLTTYANNSMLSEQAHKFIDAEFQALTEEIDRQAANSQCVKTKLFDGSLAKDGMKMHVTGKKIVMKLPSLKENDLYVDELGHHLHVSACCPACAAASQDIINRAIDKVITTKIHINQVQSELANEQDLLQSRFADFVVDKLAETNSNAAQLLDTLQCELSGNCPMDYELTFYG